MTMLDDLASLAPDLEDGGLGQTPDLFDAGPRLSRFTPSPVLPALPPDLDLASYDRVAVAMSGGKDSLACLLYLLDLGVAPEKIELHHHEVDGREGSTLFDWPITPSYCEAIAHAFGVRLIASWRVGGLEGEMLRKNAPTAAVRWIGLDGTVREAGGKSNKLGTRERFPQVAADLRVRWCSSTAKIDPMRMLLRNEERFANSRTLVVSGERAEESSNRAHYAVFERHATDLAEGVKSKRVVHVWRAVHGWREADVWARIKAHRVRPHVAYELGWGRMSCLRCIFGDPDQWASARVVQPVQFEQMAAYERRFGSTINRSRSLEHMAAAGTPYAMDEDLLRLARSTHFPPESLIVGPGQWRLPAGAFKRASGPS